MFSLAIKKDRYLLRTVFFKSDQHLVYSLISHLWWSCLDILKLTREKALLQENRHWGLSLPSINRVKVKVTQLYPTLCDPMDPWDSLGQNTGVDSLSLLQWIFPTQESNQGLLDCWQSLYQLSYQRSPSHNYKATSITGVHGRVTKISFENVQKPQEIVLFLMLVCWITRSHSHAALSFQSVSLHIQL